MKNLLKDKTVWVLLLMVGIVALSSLVLSMGFFRLPPTKIKGVYLPVALKDDDGELVATSTLEALHNQDLVTSSSTTSVSTSSITKASSTKSPKMPLSYTYISSIEKIFSLKYPIFPKTMSVNNIKEGQKLLSGYGIVFTEATTTTKTISNSQKIKGFLSTAMNLDLVNSSSAGAGYSTYTNGELYCSMSESVTNVKTIEVRCAEKK